MDTAEKQSDAGQKPTPQVAAAAARPENGPGTVGPELAGRRPIRVMPPLVAAQIAAGEVVERPASVVKELVENCIDAGAGSVTLELEQGGIELIRVVDDGGGIPEAELPLALAAHATSKLSSVDDLDRIATMGFRGEALASILSVSRMSIRSRTRSQLGAAEITGEGDVIRPVMPASGPIGTAVTVRNLFFNTPARRKFLRTPGTEQGRCLDVLTDLAMAHPAVGFMARCDGRVVIDCPAGQTPRERAVLLLGKELDSELLEASADAIDTGNVLVLWGLVGKPSLARQASTSLHLFVNGRVVRDRTLQHAVREAYRGLIEPGRWPTAVIMLDTDPSRVDVNVHPTKAEVRFRDQSAVHQGVYRAVKRALERADLTAQLGGVGGSGFGGADPLARLGAMASRGGVAGWQPPAAGYSMSDPARPPMTGPGEVRPATPGVGGGGGAGGSGPGCGASRVVSPGAFADYFRRFVPGQDQSRLSYDAIRVAVEAEDALKAGGGGVGNGPSDAAAVGRSDPAAGAAVSGEFQPAADSAVGGGEQLLDASPVPPALQVHNSFLLTQDDQGVVIVDQHALHERVMFEKLLSRVGRAPLESQRMLVPVVFKVTRRQMEVYESLAGAGGLLERIGISLEPAGPDVLACHAFTTLLFERGVDAGEFCTELLEKAGAESPSGSAAAPNMEEALRDVLDMMACKAAIKAGNRLSEVELAELLALRDTVERSSNCPHGRPTSIRLSIRDLERLFGRG